MKYSESTDYLQHMHHKVNGDFGAAKESLKLCLDHPDFRNDPIQHADLLQRLGELCFLDGQVREALKYYEQSEQADPDSLLVKYYFAEFVGFRMGDKQSAIDKCDVIILEARSRPFPETEDDISSDAYLRKAEQLKASLLL